MFAGKPNGGQKDDTVSGQHLTPEPRTFVEAPEVELDPIHDPAKATSATVARGVNKLHKCVESGFADIKAEMEVIRGALHIDKEGKPIGGSKPIGLLSSWEAGWRGALVIFGGLSATAFVWKMVVFLGPAFEQLLFAINNFVVKHT